MLRSVVRGQRLPASDVSKKRSRNLQTDVMFRARGTIVGAAADLTRR
jgi:hypothetical protein